MWCVDLDMELWMDGSFLWLRQSLTEIDISAIYLFGFCFVLPFVLRFLSFGLIMMLWIFIREVSEILDIAYETQYLFLGLKCLACTLHGVGLLCKLGTCWRYYFDWHVNLSGGTICCRLARLHVLVRIWKGPHFASLVVKGYRFQ